jgi:hypothetical protein
VRHGSLSFPRGGARGRYSSRMTWQGDTGGFNTGDRHGSRLQRKGKRRHGKALVARCLVQPETYPTGGRSVRTTATAGAVSLPSRPFSHSSPRSILCFPHVSRAACISNYIRGSLVRLFINPGLKLNNNHNISIAQRCVVVSGHRIALELEYWCNPGVISRYYAVVKVRARRTLLRVAHSCAL